MPTNSHSLNISNEITNSIQSIITEKGESHSMVAVCDIDGVFRGKKINTNKLYKGFKDGIGFSDVVVGWDLEDALYTDSKLSNWGYGYGDIPLIVDINSCRVNPLDNNNLYFIGELKGRLNPVCPRGLLRQAVNYAKDKGYLANVACEYEFVILNETSLSIKEKQYKNLSLGGSSVRAYSVVDSTLLSELLNQILDTCHDMKVPIESIHPESGMGVYEAALVHSDPISAADNASLFKMIAKIIAQKHGKLVTFIPKIEEGKPGQGGHIHMSIISLDGNSVFYDENCPDNISHVMKYFIGGLQRLIPELVCMTVPTINGFKRLVPGFWAPNNIEWGVENRSCGLRVIGDCQNSLHIEYRISGSDINPYIAIAAILRAGIWGIENKVEARQPAQGNADITNYKLPNSLDEAVRLFKKSKIAKELFGEVFVDHYSYTREWEVTQYAKHISRWELDRYLEVI